MLIRMLCEQRSRNRGQRRSRVPARNAAADITGRHQLFYRYGEIGLQHRSKFTGGNASANQHAFHLGAEVVLKKYHRRVNVFDQTVWIACSGNSMIETAEQA